MIFIYINFETLEKNLDIKDFKFVPMVIFERMFSDDFFSGKKVISNIKNFNYRSYYGSYEELIETYKSFSKTYTYQTLNVEKDSIVLIEYLNDFIKLKSDFPDALTISFYLQEDEKVESDLKIQYTKDYRDYDGGSLFFINFTDTNVLNFIKNNIY